MYSQGNLRPEVPWRLADFSKVNELYAVSDAQIEQNKASPPWINALESRRASFAKVGRGLPYG